MAYVRGVPTDEIIRDSRSKLATNTNTADDSFGIDHVKFSVATNAGYHHFLHLDQVDDGNTDITAPTAGTDITNIFATNTLITTTKPLPVFRNATGVGFLTPTAAAIRFSHPGSVASGMQFNATVTRSGTIYTIKFDKLLEDDNYFVMVSAEGPSGTTYPQPSVYGKTTALFYLSNVGNDVTYVSVIVFGLISQLHT